MVTKNTKPTELSIRKVIKTLQEGKLSIIGQALRGSNSTFLTRIENTELTLQAIYKPSKGEQPLWDFPDFTLAQREVAAFVVSFLLGWNLVPPTIFRLKPAIYGKGSLQLFIQHDPLIHFLNSPAMAPIVLSKIVLFDLLINNADRKAGHVIFDPENKPWLIDHGLCFNHEFKHRTVIWDMAGLEIPHLLKDDLRKFVSFLLQKNVNLVKKLNMLLSEMELNSMIKRGLFLIDQDNFPYPEPNRRSYPWPPI